MNAVSKTIASIEETLRLEEDTIVTFLKFGSIGFAGVLVNTLVLYMLVSYTSLHYLIAAAIATELAIISNFVGNQLYTFRTTKNNLSLPAKFVRFQTVSIFALVLTLAILAALTNLFGIEYLLIWNLIAISISSMANFALNRKITWRKTP